MKKKKAYSVANAGNQGWHNWILCFILVKFVIIESQTFEKQIARKCFFLCMHGIRAANFYNNKRVRCNCIHFLDEFSIRWAVFESAVHIVYEIVSFWLTLPYFLLCCLFKHPLIVTILFSPGRLNKFQQLKQKMWTLKGRERKISSSVELTKLNFLLQYT